MIRFENIARPAVLACALAAVLALPAQAADITITKVGAEIEADGDTIDVFMEIANSGGVMDTLYAANTSIASGTKISAISEEEEEKMEAAGQVGTQATALPIMPGKTLTLSEDGAHLELSGLSRKMKEGDEFDVTLFFENAGPVVISVEIEDD